MAAAAPDAGAGAAPGDRPAPPARGAPLLEVRGLAKRYGAGTGDRENKGSGNGNRSAADGAETSVPVFADIDLDIAAGEFVALLGESGVGKSTLLNCIAGLDTVQAGRVTIRPHRGMEDADDAGRTAAVPRPADVPGSADAGSTAADPRAPGAPDRAGAAGTSFEVTALAEADAARLRREHLGFVFQAFHVLPHLDVFHNVALPLLLLRRRDDDRVRQVLAEVGLDRLERRLPQQLSGGQLQRVAIARALVHRPALLLADEPTGNLDPSTAERVIDLLARQVRAEGAACLLVTHSRLAAARADRTLVMTSGGMRPAP